MARELCLCNRCKGRIAQTTETRRDHMRRYGRMETPIVDAVLPPQLAEQDLPDPQDASLPSPPPIYDFNDSYYDIQYDYDPAVDDSVVAGAPEAVDDDDALSLASEEMSAHSDAGADDWDWAEEYEVGLEDRDDGGEEQEEEEEGGIVLEAGRDYVDRENIFPVVGEGDTGDGFGGFADGGDDGDEEDMDEAPPAFDEPDAFRNAYIRIFANHAFQNATHVQTKGMVDALVAAFATGPLQDELATFARTLPTIERRLGLCLENDIIYFILCPNDSCWKRYDPSVLTDPEFDVWCSRCQTRLYNTKRLASGKEKRVPLKIMPFYAPDRIIQWMLLRPGKYEECQSWRRAELGDGDIEAPPISFEDWQRTFDPDAPMHDMHDGWRWRNIEAYIEREWNPETKKVEDVRVRGKPIRFVALPCGLMLTLSIDWFQPMTGRTHSSGALWLTVNNLPRAIRFLPGQGTFLVLMIPGPHEPSKECLNECTQPVTKRLLALYRGKYMRVHNHDEKEVVNATPNVVAADGPARLKMGGFVSTNSEEHMCTVCKQPFSALVHPHCFNRDVASGMLRDEGRQLRYKFLAAASRNREYIDEIATRKGVRASTLDEIPGWRPTLGCPPELMHMLYLRLMNVIHKDIILGSGML
ncbi:POC1 centriolar protein-like protein A [Mycena kentingensis (nom. inval.)]|nr:POC1 centriolar protein-like protein A [Mycena kentingensis (nom. inval.)]